MIKSLLDWPQSHVKEVEFVATLWLLLKICKMRVFGDYVLSEDKYYQRATNYHNSMMLKIILRTVTD